MEVCYDDFPKFRDHLMNTAAESLNTLHWPDTGSDSIYGDELASIGNYHNSTYDQSKFLKPGQQGSDNVVLVSKDAFVRDHCRGPCSLQYYGRCQVRVLASAMALGSTR